MSLASPIFWINGVPSRSVDVMDRGLAYGDGLFETLRWSGGQCIDLDAHLDRMLKGLTRLVFEASESIIVQLRAELKQFENTVLKSIPSCTLKLVVTRGSGGRGYGLPAMPVPTRIIMALPLLEKDAALYESGIDIASSSYQLGHTPYLSGIKHLSRLEQVVARASLDQLDAIEGLVADIEGNLIEGISSNVFILKQNMLLTPKLDLCGIDGIVRQNVILAAKELPVTVKIIKIPMVSVSQYSAMFLTNSLIGIMPVKSWAGCHFDPHHPVLKALQLKINQSMKIKL